MPVFGSGAVRIPEAAKWHLLFWLLSDLYTGAKGPAMREKLERIIDRVQRRYNTRKVSIDGDLKKVSILGESPITALHELMGVFNRHKLSKQQIQCVFSQLNKPEEKVNLVKDLIGVDTDEDRMILKCVATVAGAKGKVEEYASGKIGVFASKQGKRLIDYIARKSPKKAAELARTLKDAKTIGRTTRDVARRHKYTTGAIAGVAGTLAVQAGRRKRRRNEYEEEYAGGKLGVFAGEQGKRLIEYIARKSPKKAAALARTLKDVKTAGKATKRVIRQHKYTSGAVGGVAGTLALQAHARRNKRNYEYEEDDGLSVVKASLGRIATRLGRRGKAIRSYKSTKLARAAKQAEWMRRGNALETQRWAGRVVDVKRKEKAARRRLIASGAAAGVGALALRRKKKKPREEYELASRLRRILPYLRGISRKKKLAALAVSGIGGAGIGTAASRRRKDEPLDLDYLHYYYPGIYDDELGGIYENEEYAGGNKVFTGTRIGSSGKTVHVVRGTPNAGRAGRVASAKAAYAQRRTTTPQAPPKAMSPARMARRTRLSSRKLSTQSVSPGFGHTRARGARGTPVRRRGGSSTGTGARSGVRVYKPGLTRPMGRGGFRRYTGELDNLKKRMDGILKKVNNIDETSIRKQQPDSTWSPGEGKEGTPIQEVSPAKLKCSQCGFVVDLDKSRLNEVVSLRCSRCGAFGSMKLIGMGEQETPPTTEGLPPVGGEAQKNSVNVENEGGMAKLVGFMGVKKFGED